MSIYKQHDKGSGSTSTVTYGQRLLQSPELYASLVFLQYLASDGCRVEMLRGRRSRFEYEIAKVA